MSSARRQPPRIRLRFLLLMNLVFCMLLGALYWASRVPMIAEEINLLLGRRSGNAASDSRTVHVIFVMFTYTAPLLLAGLLSTMRGVWRYLERRRPREALSANSQTQSLDS